MTPWRDMSPQERYAILGVGAGIAAVAGVAIFTYTNKDRIARAATIEMEMSPADRLAFARAMECGRYEMLRGLAASGQESVQRIGPKPESSVMDVITQRLYTHLGLKMPKIPCGSAS